MITELLANIRTPYLDIALGLSWVRINIMYNLLQAVSILFVIDSEFVHESLLVVREENHLCLIQLDAMAEIAGNGS